MSRSICVHPDHRPTVTAALDRQGFTTQGDLAANTFVNLSTVSRFFRGIRISVANFEHLCEALDLEPKAIMLPADTPSPISHLPSSKEPALHGPPAAKSVSQFFAYDPFWVGRELLISTLSQKLQTTCRLLLLAGISGVGKTALAERLASELQPGELQSSELQPGSLTPTRPPLKLLRENFDNPEQPIDFASVAARLLEASGQIVLPEERSQPQLLARRLVAHLQQTPTLILIDSLENILEGNEQDGWSEFKDSEFVSFFQAVLATETFSSRFILTSQELPAQIQSVGSRYQNSWHAQPLSGLSVAEQQTGCIPLLQLSVNAYGAEADIFAMLKAC